MATSNLKVVFSAPTKKFEKDMESGKTAVKGFTGQAGGAFSKFAQLFGVNMSAVNSSMAAAKSQAVAMGAGFKGAATGTSFLTKGLKIMKLALISSGVGILVVALGALVTLFTRSSAWGDKLSSVMSGMKAVISVLMDRFAKLGGALIKLIHLDFTGAAADAKAAFAGVTEEMNKEYSIAKKLKELTLDLERNAKMYEAEKAHAMTEITNLRAIARDKLTNDQVRVAAIKKAGLLEEKIAKKNLTLADQELAAALDQYDAKSKTLKLSKEAQILVEKIKNGTIDGLEAQEAAKNLTLDDAKGKETLYNLIDKIVNRESQQQKIISTNYRLKKAESAVIQEIANKSIAAYASQAKLLKNRAANEKLDYNERIELIRKASESEQQGLKTALNNNLIDRQKYTAEAEILQKELIENENKLNGNLTPLKMPEADTVEKHVKLQLVTDADGVSKWHKVITDAFETDKLQAFADDHKAAAEQVSELWENASKLLSSTFQNLAVSFGSMVGNLVAGTGGLSAIPIAVGKMFGQMCISLGTMIIASATGLKKLGEAFRHALTSPAAPIAAIGAGVALVAIGTAITASLSSISSGGSGNYSDNSGVFDTTGDYSATSGTLNADNTITVNIQGTFKTSGKDLVATINNESQVAQIRK